MGLKMRHLFVLLVVAAAALLPTSASASSTVHLLSWRLDSPRGVEFIGPEAGMLACGYEGVGRLWKVDEIAFRAEFLLARQQNLIA